MAGIYIHIPFCAKRCVYCDFYSTTRAEQKKAYVDAVCRELAERRGYLHSAVVETVYFGGGTPSQLSAHDLECILTHIFGNYNVSADCEITMEANPDDLDDAYVQQLRRLPFNRLSMGIQTFHDPTLHLLQRRHSAKEAAEAYVRCREAGFANISIDLMYGLPGQTLELWREDVARAIDLHPQHISSYALTYEDGTALWKLRQAGKVREADEETSRAMYTLLVDELRQAGYQHYEISNFCMPSFHSRHNTSYWQGTPYLGVGAGAHSYDGSSRQWNKPDLDAYLASRPFYREELDLPTRYNEFVMTRLRTVWGFSLQQLLHIFGSTLHDYCLHEAQPHIERQLLEIVGDTIRLTPQGVFVSDGIMSDLMWVD
ncbi:MAG: radical SAM family heme chaperone HemW [Bacteroidales bacterium]|nr:radical SAM family heme chaperone HemW [Bacteroidales bacterium]